jgi:hypothetical protein
MTTLVCTICGELIEVSELAIVESGSRAIIRKGFDLSCSSCKAVFASGDELVLEYELGNHSTMIWKNSPRRQF